MDEEKCSYCGKLGKMTEMLVCSNCGAFFCAPCANMTGNLCPQCLGMLTRLN